MIQLYNRRKNNIGRGVVIMDCGSPCKRRIKAVGDITDANGTRTVVDVSRGLRTGYASLYDLRPLDKVWDNWHAYYRDELPRLEARAQDYVDRWDELAEAWGDVKQLRRAYDLAVRERDHVATMLARMDAATEKRRHERQLRRNMPVIVATGMAMAAGVNIGPMRPKAPNLKPTGKGE